MRRGILAMLVLGLLAGTCQASIQLFDNKVDFDAAAYTTTIVFGNDGGNAIDFYEHQGDLFRPDPSGVEFQTEDWTDLWVDKELGVADANEKVGGVRGTAGKGMVYTRYNRGRWGTDVPYDTILTAVLPDDTYAVAAVFGQLLDSLGVGGLVPGTITLYDADGNELTSVMYAAADIAQMQDGGTFQGWTSTDTAIAKLVYDAEDSSYMRAAMADFQYGTVIPEPASSIVWSLIGLSLLGAGWSRRRRSA